MIKWSYLRDGSVAFGARVVEAVLVVVAHVAHARVWLEEETALPVGDEVHGVVPLADAEQHELVVDEVHLLEVELEIELAVGVGVDGALRVRAQVKLHHLLGVLHVEQGEMALPGALEGGRPRAAVDEPAAAVPRVLEEVHVAAVGEGHREAHALVLVVSAHLVVEQRVLAVTQHLDELLGGGVVGVLGRAEVVE